MDAAGDFVVAWTSYGQNGSAFGIYAQRFAAAPPVVTGIYAAGNVLTAGQRLVSTLPSLLVTFNEDLPTSGTNAVTSVSNWSLTRNGIDVSAQIASISFVYNATTGRYEATLSFTAPLTDGSYVLTAKQAIQDLAGNALDGDSNGIAGGDFSRAFTIAQPVASGAEFRVNTTTANSQSTFPQSPGSVATDVAGDFVVTWSSTGQDGSGYGVYAQRYNAAGVAQGGEFKVNSYTTNNQTNATVAMEAAGDFVITWSSYGQDAANGWGVYAQRYNAAAWPRGASSRSTPTRRTARSTPRWRWTPRATLSSPGAATGRTAAASANYAQRYNAAGVAQGGEFQVNSYTTSTQEFSTVSMDAAGNFVVTWSSSGQDGSGFGVYAQRYNAAGVAQGGEFKVNSYTTSDQVSSTVAMDAAGDFVVVWSSNGQDGSSGGVYAQRYNAAGVAQGGEFQVNTYTTSTQRFSTVATDAAGDFVVTWSSYGPGRKQLRRLRPAVQRGGGGPGGRVQGQHLHDEQPALLHGVDGRRGRLRRRVEQLSAGRQRRRRLRPAVWAEQRPNHYGAGKRVRL